MRHREHGPRAHAHPLAMPAAARRVQLPSPVERAAISPKRTPGDAFVMGIRHLDSPEWAPRAVHGLSASPQDRSGAPGESGPWSLTALDIAALAHLSERHVRPAVRSRQRYPSPVGIPSLIHG
jgi:hypothetical protein